MKLTDALERGRSAFSHRSWGEAFEQLSVADHETPLGPEDLETLATAAHLSGKDDESAATWARAHQEFLTRGDVERAVRCAFWLIVALLDAGDAARAAGWIARANRLLAESDEDCVERGYLLLPVAQRQIAESDYPGAFATLARAVGIGERCGDRELVALARHASGRVLIRQGQSSEGVALLDEAMAAVEAGELSPRVVGEVYCSVIAGCQEIFDIRRAQEWTAALNRWCESQPDLVPYRGECLVWRAEILQLRGSWTEALDEARRACDRLSQPGRSAFGAAVYRLAELHRLAGDFDRAEEAYREASTWSRKPRPGLALLWLAQGQVDAAVAAIRRALDESSEPRTRSHVLPAYVEILLASDDIAEARAAADELTEIASGLDAPFLRAVALQAHGAVLLAEGDANAAIDALCSAASLWEQLEIPYEVARARLLVARAGRQLGDAKAAEIDLDAACRVFRQLGAVPDLAYAESFAGREPADDRYRLTPRELQVLRRVAAGESNKAIAAGLFISERTVERHVSNIFGKLGVSSRAAATAFAYEHGLV